MPIDPSLMPKQRGGAGPNAASAFISQSSASLGAAEALFHLAPSFGFSLCPFSSSQIDVEPGKQSYFVVLIAFYLSSGFEFYFFLPSLSKTAAFGKI